MINVFLSADCDFPSAEKFFLNLTKKEKK